jgi:hypothetical protein
MASSALHYKKSDMKHFLLALMLISHPFEEDILEGVNY